MCPGDFRFANDQHRLGDEWERCHSLLDCKHHNFSFPPTRKKRLWAATEGRPEVVGEYSRTLLMGAVQKRDVETLRRRHLTHAMQCVSV